jgi:hypothetical protein
LNAVKSILSALATVDQDQLQRIQSYLLPHKVVPQASLGNPEAHSNYEIPESMLDDEGNLSMFVGQDEPSPGKFLVCDDATENYNDYQSIEPLIPMPQRLTSGQLRSGDSYSEGCASPSECSTQCSEDLIVNSLRQVKRKRFSITPIERLQSHNTSKRVRMASQSVTETQVSAENQPDSEPVIQADDPEPISASSPSASHFLRSQNRLRARFGENSDYKLTSDQIIDVIEAGDSFLRDNPSEFVTSSLRDCTVTSCNTNVPYPTSDGTLIEKLFKCLRTAEILDERSLVDPIRLRIARILLFWYYEQLCETYSQDRSQKCSRGKGKASLVTDRLIEELYKGETPCSEILLKKVRTSVQWNKQIGKRWAKLISYMGPGFLLVCCPNLVKRV